jgi:hypothetical protein
MKQKLYENPFIIHTDTLTTQWRYTSLEIWGSDGSEDVDFGLMGYNISRTCK